MDFISGTQLKMTIEYSDGQKITLLLKDWGELRNKLELMGLNSYSIYSELMTHSYIDDHLLLGIDHFYNNGKIVQCITINEFDSEKHEEEETSEIVKKEEFKNSEMTIFKKYPHLVDISIKGSNIHYYSILPDIDSDSLTEEEKQILDKQNARLYSI